MNSMVQDMDGATQQNVALVEQAAAAAAAAVTELGDRDDRLRAL